jgi:hypothetical protein
VTLLAKVYISGATFTFIGGIALLTNASDNLGWSSFVFSGILLKLHNDQPEVPRRK